MVNGDISYVLLTYANGIKQAICYDRGGRTREQAITQAEASITQHGGTWGDKPAPQEKGK